MLKGKDIKVFKLGLKETEISLMSRKNPFINMPIRWLAAYKCVHTVTYQVEPVFQVGEWGRGC
jgi:hypothetical protein